MEARDQPVSKIHTSRNYTIGVLVLDLPGSHPLVVAVYASAQRSRPLSPSQLARRLDMLRHTVDRLRGKLYTQADIVYALIAPAGFTRGAARNARRTGALIARTAKEAGKRIAAYLAARYNALRRRIAGRRIWGPLPLLLYSLAVLAKTLGAPLEPPSEEEIIHAATRGARLPPPT